MADAAEKTPAPGSIEDLFGPVISTYSAKQGVEDGFLVDLGQFAPDVIKQHMKEGWRVICTPEVFEIFEKAEANEKWHNDWSGLIHDLLWMKRFGADVDEFTRIWGLRITGAGRKKKFVFQGISQPYEVTDPNSVGCIVIKYLPTYSF